VRTNAPSARFTLDGRPVGDGTGVLQVPQVVPGRHVVTIEAPGYERREEAIDVLEGSTNTQELVLEQSAARGGAKKPPHAGSSSKSPRPGSPSQGGNVDVNATSGWPPK
jgi:hypothetical protein